MGETRSHRSDHGEVNPDELAAQFRRWLGQGVGVAAARIEGERELFAEEERYVANAIASRRAEFSTGRWCAREALRTIGQEPVAIPMGPFRGPVWPEGVCGSITHDAGVSIAVAARVQDYSGIGIDLLDPGRATPILEEAGSVLDAPGDRYAADLPVAPRVLFFGAKESVIKAVSEKLGRWLDFTEIGVRCEAESFEARVNGVSAPLLGRWGVHDGLVLTAVTRGLKFPAA